MITDKDVKKLKAVFATKDDLQRFATKADLQRFATKEDLKSFATKDDLRQLARKDDLKQFATKDDLLALDNRMEQKFVTKDYLEKTLDERFEQFFRRLEIYLDHRFRPLEEMAVDYYKFKDYVTDKLDWLVGKYQKFEDEHMILTTQYSSLNKRTELLEEKNKI